MVAERSLVVHPIGWVESPLVDRDQAPKQGDEGAPDVWIAFEQAVVDGLRDLQIGSDVLVLTWLDRARRDVLEVHPRGQQAVLRTSAHGAMFDGSSGVPRFVVKTRLRSFPQQLPTLRHSAPARRGEALPLRRRRWPQAGRQARPAHVPPSTASSVSGSRAIADQVGVRTVTDPPAGDSAVHSRKANGVLGLG